MYVLFSIGLMRWKIKELEEVPSLKHLPSQQIRAVKKK